MTNYLLDTNIVSDLVRHPQGRVAENIQRVGEPRVATSIIVAAELRYGAAKKASPRLSAQLEAILQVLPVLALEAPTDRGGRAALPAGKIGAKGREIPKGGPPPGSEFGAAPARRSAGLGPQGPQAGVSTSGTRGAAAQGPAPTIVFYGRLRFELERLGQPIGGKDLWIAAQALALGRTLVTVNTREFSRVPGLALENWLQPPEVPGPAN